MEGKKEASKQAMHWQYNPFIMPLVLSATLCTFLAVLMWRRRKAIGAWIMGFLMVAMAAWSVMYAFELAVADLPSMIFWSKVEFLGFLAVPALWLVFVLQYTGREQWLKAPILSVLVIAPLVILLLVWTNEAHGLIYRQISLDTSRPYALLELTYGPAWIAQGIYGYALFACATILLLITFIRSAEPYRRHLIPLLLGALIPIAANVLYVEGLIPVPNLDLTPFAFTVTGILAAWALMHYRFLDIMPIAHDALIKDLHDGVVVLDAQERVLHLNRAASALLGHSAHEIVGLPIADLLENWRVITGGGQVDETARAEITLNGTYPPHYVDLHVSTLPKTNGRVDGWLIILKDISERKTIERAELEQRALANALTNTLAVLARAQSLDEMLDRILLEAAEVVPHDASSIMMAEGSVARIVRARGSVERDPAGWSLQLHMPIDETPSLYQMVETKTMLCISDTKTDSRWRANPESEWVRSYIGAPILVKRNVVGFLNLDSAHPSAFTERQGQQVQLFADEIGVAIENAQLHTSLAQANAELELALKAKDEMLQNVSHELRTPLTILMGYIDLINEQSLGEVTSRQQGALDEMRSQAQRLHLLVNSLLTLQRFDAEKLNLQPMDLAPWLRSIVEFWQVRTRQLGSQLSLDAPAELPLVMAAPDFLDLVMSNLLDNAIKFSPSKGQIFVNAQAQADAVVIGVTDQGIGLEPQQLERIFERFYQVDGSTTRRAGGVGVGLALCSEIVRAHGGQIWADSAGLGRGATFKICLPTA